MPSSSRRGTLDLAPDRCVVVVSQEHPMDGSRFDALTQTLMAAGSRRRALVLALGGTLAPLLAQKETEAKKKKACPPCKKRKKGKCKANLPDGMGCSGGTCQGGAVSRHPCLAAPWDSG